MYMNECVHIVRCQSSATNKCGFWITYIDLLDNTEVIIKPNITLTNCSTRKHSTRICTVYFQ
jgi:hypothetical protein